MTPFFSVVIPVYNRAAILAEAVQSVLAQTCQDFEIVVVDDGSQDDPKRVLDAFGDSRIRYLRQDNRGGGAARNTGMDAASGRYVALLDSDDYFLPGHLEAMKHLVEGAAHIFAYAPVIADRGDGRSIVKPFRALNPGEHMAEYLLSDRGFTPTTTMVVDVQAARRVRFPEDLRCAEDTDFAIRLALDGCTIAMAPEPGAYWRDIADPNRTSAVGRKNLAMIPWIEALKPNITRRAYYGCYGWAIAKSVVLTNPVRAFWYYLRALLHGCYRPPLAAVVFLQIFLPDAAYRWIADTGIGWFGAFWRRRSSSAPA